MHGVHGEGGRGWSPRSSWGSAWWSGCRSRATSSAGAPRASDRTRGWSRSRGWSSARSRRTRRCGPSASGGRARAPGRPRPDQRRPGRRGRVPQASRASRTRRSSASRPAPSDKLAREYGQPQASDRFRYVVTTSVVVKTPNVDLVRTALGATEELLKSGVVLDGEREGGAANPRYIVSKFNDLRPQLLADATRNARATAQQFAADSGAQVGSIRSANQGSIQIFGLDGGDESAPFSATSTPVKRIRVVSTFEFGSLGRVRAEQYGYCCRRVTRSVRYLSPARLVLHAHLRGPEERRHRLRPEHPAAASRPTAARPSTRSRRRTATTTTSGSTRRPAAHDRGQRRRGQRLLQRRRAGRRDNQPTAQFYHVITDNRVPVLGLRRAAGQHDGLLPSRANDGGHHRTSGTRSAAARAATSRPARRPEHRLRGQLRRRCITRYDHAHGPGARHHRLAGEPIGRRRGATLKYRFQWTFPIVLSPHDPDMLYTGSNTSSARPTRADLGGDQPDLTRNDPEKQGSVGRTDHQDNTGIEFYGTIFAFAESPHEKGVIWAGTDDGLVHVSRDSGKTWHERHAAASCRSGRDQPDRASPHDAGTAYVAATATSSTTSSPTSEDHRLRQDLDDDHQRHPDGDFTRVVREDPERRGLLYAGTETGVYVSFDDGAHWQPLQLQPAGRADPRPDRARATIWSRHARPLLLDSR